MNIRTFFGQAADMAAIRALMMRYKLALDTADVELILQCHAEGDDISAVSLDSTYAGRDEVRRFFHKLFSPAVREGVSPPPKRVHIAIHHDTAALVLEHEIRLRRPNPSVLPVRVSFTLVRCPPDWRILSSHVSAPRTAFVHLGDAAH